MRDSLRQKILARCQEKADQPIFSVIRRFGDSRLNHLTGAEIMSRAGYVQALWDDCCGAKPRTVVLAFDHGELFLTSLIACVLGHDTTIVPIAKPRPGAQASRARHIVVDSGATAVFCEAGQVDNLVKALTNEGSASLPCPVFGLDPDGKMTEQAGDVVEGLLCESDAGSPPILVQYTSGSTRLPKGVRIFAEQILANEKLGSDRFRISETTRFMNWLPHYHDMGLMGGILYPLMRGGYSAQMSPYDMVRSPAFWLKNITALEATMSGGPAFAFSHALQHVSDKDIKTLDLSSWATAFCGAEPVPRNLLPAFRARFAHCGLKPEAVFACYGMAEYTLYAAGEKEIAPVPQSQHNTYPCQLTAETRDVIRIVDPDTRKEQPAGTQGEIWLRGASMGGGYMNLPDETEATFGVLMSEGEGNTDRWLRTGDLGLIEDDWLYITGRIKDIIIANGRKIAATEIEWLAASQDKALNPAGAAAFMSDPLVSGNAVLMIERKNNRVHIEDETRLIQTIRRAVQGEWGIHLDEVHILARGELDRTSSGKIRRQAIAANWRQKQNAVAGVECMGGVL